MLQCDNGAIPERGLIRVEDDINDGSSHPIRDIQVGRNVARDHDLHPNRQLDGFR